MSAKEFFQEIFTLPRLRFSHMAVVAVSLLFVGACLFWLADSALIPAIIHGRDEVSAPNVVGTNVGTAVSLLKSKGFVIHEIKEIHDDKSPEGVVLNQNPSVNAIVKEGRHVYLTVSKGRERATIPDLRGGTLREARIALMNVGMEIGLLKYENSETVEKDRIIAQSMPAGAKITIGESVGFVISKGSQFNFAVPNLIGMSLDEATAILEKQGFIVGNIHREYDGAFMKSTVIDQSPASGEMPGEGAAVDLTVSE